MFCALAVSGDSLGDTRPSVILKGKVHFRWAKNVWLDDKFEEE